jgi:hypothetical protein
MVSDKDREYMRRIGAYKEASHREAQQHHLSLSLDERLERSWELYVRYHDAARCVDNDEGVMTFYDRARRLGLYCP